MVKPTKSKVAFKVSKRRVPTRIIRNRRRRVSKLTTTNRSPTIVTAVRSLLSYLPGQSIIKPLADFIFKGFGYSNDIAISNVKDFRSDNVSFVGLYSSVRVSVGDILAFERASVRSEAGEIYEGATFKSKIAYVKVLDLELVLRNTTPSGKKTGNWAAFVQPIKHLKQKELNKNYTYKDICEMQGAKIATAREDIIIRISNFPTYWYCGREMNIEDIICLIFVGFEDLNRTNYVEFTSDDFSCSGTISATFKVLANYPGERTESHGYKIKDLYGAHELTVFGKVKDNPSAAPKLYRVASTQCAKYNEATRVIGKVVNVEGYENLSLEEMEI